jgi:para-nitrobenzyl esterase
VSKDLYSQSSIPEEFPSKYVPTYAYEFDDENAPDRSLPSFGFPYGAAHTFELQYLFDLSNTPYQGTLSAPQQRLAMARTSRHCPSSRRPQLTTDYSAEHNCSFWDAG